MHNFEKKYTIYNVHEEKVDPTTIIPVHAATTMRKRLSMCKMPSIATLSINYSNK